MEGSLLSFTWVAPAVSMAMLVIVGQSGLTGSMASARYRCMSPDPSDHQTLARKLGDGASIAFRKLRRAPPRCRPAGTGAPARTAHQAPPPAAAPASWPGSGTGHQPAP